MARVELTPEENLLLLQEIEANRAFILLAYQSDPALLKLADPQIRRLFENVDEATRETDDGSSTGSSNRRNHRPCFPKPTAAEL